MWVAPARNSNQQILVPPLMYKARLGALLGAQGGHMNSCGYFKEKKANAAINMGDINAGLWG